MALILISSLNSQRGNKMKTFSAFKAIFMFSPIFEWIKMLIVNKPSGLRSTIQGGIFTTIFLVFIMR